MSDLISRQAAIDALAQVARKTFNLSDEYVQYLAGLMDGENAIRQLPSAQPERKGRWTTDEVAELLYKMFGEECACNFNGIDEWLPMACKYAETTCTDPEEKHGCWKQFLLQGGAKMEVEHEDTLSMQ